MSDNSRVQGIKIIGGVYKVIKALFQVRSYLYAQVCAMTNYQILNTAMYVYENEDPSQSLKMLSQKLSMSDRSDSGNLIFPSHHIKEPFNDKNISLFFFDDFIIPLRCFEKRTLSCQQYLQALHGALSCLNLLHMRDVLHGNISLNTCYMVRNKTENQIKFALNILDTNYFTEDQCSEGLEDKLFQSQGHSLGLQLSFKDDLQSLVYVMTHILAKGKLFTMQRFQLQWITQSQFLRWKSCEFFKEMIHIVPPELNILIQIYTIAKSLRRNQKPDYMKLIKKVINTINEERKKTKIRQSSANEGSIVSQKVKSLQGGKQSKMVNKQIKQADIKVTFKQEERDPQRQKRRKISSDNNEGKQNVHKRQSGELSKTKTK